jgi:G:T-mismatch repair DNA endonuclease (very short patch repair protein)
VNEHALELLMDDIGDRWREHRHTELGMPDDVEMHFAVVISRHRCTVTAAQAEQREAR